ncbi:dihydrolipoamide acetyltransferase [Oceanicola granulosus HTCC2516]|uniref:Dihydrolipoyllysine-residue succinyltransferase n=1 Tax=Oceanicola granulosus (strain ATCC BAA-861 / DSM 15982 / KCTC 12143 / HTCC2516) TaxID=314256 RepID=Q2CI25_OCEGH|nr:2-oxoglutarate dehydrogenase complex dihydrolipoyllysine-residue succinyltransferase [Oceanicola granulosus]EAR52433.1 dihydrolipoamide acetyltransferase [Oceanicola granulosus HTCC2516]
MSVEVRVPALGESVTEATVATWFKKPGDAVEADEMLCELETDKVTVEVPSPAAGKLDEIVAAEGETVGVDALLANIAEAGHAGSSTDIKPREGKSANPEPAEPDAGTEGKSGADGSGDGGGGGEEIEITVPALGESVTEATVSTWFKKPGDSFEADEMLCELETDKVSVEVPAPAAGTLSKLLAEEGATVEAGGKLALMTTGKAAASAKAEGTPATTTSQTPEGDRGGYGDRGTPDTPPTTESRGDIEDAPSAKKMMAEKNLSADAVTGTGKGGRIMKEDVLNALNKPQQAEAPKPQAARAPSTPADADREERVKMTRLRQTIARRLKEAQNNAAMLTTYNEVDMGGIMDLRNEYKDLFLKKHGVKLGFMSFFVKACCHALNEVPDVNAEIDGTDVVYKNYVNMGIAVGTPNGLVVPVVRDAHEKGFAQIEKEIAELGAKGRDGKLSMADMQGGSFTISNGGVYGSLMSSPILNPPQSGILGMHKIQERPMVVKGQIVARPMMYLALSYDHRIVDGKGAVTFLVRVKEALEDPRRLLMDL